MITEASAFALLTSCAQHLLHLTIEAEAGGDHVLMSFNLSTVHRVRPVKGVDILKRNWSAAARSHVCERRLVACATFAFAHNKILETEFVQKLHGCRLHANTPKPVHNAYTCEPEL